jgi:hypothetical protein
MKFLGTDGTFLPASQDAGNRIGHVPIILEAFVEFVEF